MSRVLTTDKLIDTVRRRSMSPEDSRTFKDEDIIDILNEEIDVSLLAKIMSLNEEHMVAEFIHELKSDQTRYKIPHRAVGNKLRDVAYRDTSGAHYELSRISLEELSDYRYYRNSQREDVFYVEADEIVLVDTRLANFDNLLMYYYLRPSRLVKEDRTAKIGSIDRTTGLITLSNYPDNFTQLTEVDFVGFQSPNKIRAIDVSLTSNDRNTSSIMVDPSDIPVNLIKGDYVTVPEESPVPNFPTEFHPVLAQMAVIHMLGAMNDTEGVRNATAKLVSMEEATMQIIDDRVEGAPQKINARHSPLVNATLRYNRYKSRL